MSIAASANQSADWKWLYSRRIDLHFLFGFLTLALALVAVIAHRPELFVPILLADLWLLGYHHVIATYTRLCFDRESLVHSRHLIFALLPAVAAATVLLAAGAGIWAVFNLYFYWQWFHYTRQSWGVSRAYRARDPECLHEDGWLD